MLLEENNKNTLRIDSQCAHDEMCARESNEPANERRGDAYLSLYRSSNTLGANRMRETLSFCVALSV